MDHHRGARRTSGPQIAEFIHISWTFCVFAAVSSGPNDCDALPDETHYRSVTVRRGERGANRDMRSSYALSDVDPEPRYLFFFFK